MVPRCVIASSRLMPMPWSRTVSVAPLASLSIQIARSLSLPSSSGFDNARKRSLSLASEALEINSRRKMSLWLYREWIIRFSSSRTSAWKPSVSRSLDMLTTVSTHRGNQWYRALGLMFQAIERPSRCRAAFSQSSISSQSRRNLSKWGIRVTGCDDHVRRRCNRSPCCASQARGCFGDVTRYRKNRISDFIALLAAQPGYAKLRNDIIFAQDRVIHAAYRRAEPEGRFRQDNHRHQSGESLCYAR